MAEEKSYYDILGVDKGSSQEEIKTAYKILARRYHPDRLQQADGAERRAAEERIKEINNAYNTLKDKEKRLEYDNRARGPYSFYSRPQSGQEAGAQQQEQRFYSYYYYRDANKEAKEPSLLGAILKIALGAAGAFLLVSLFLGFLGFIISYFWPVLLILLLFKLFEPFTRR